MAWGRIAAALPGGHLRGHGPPPPVIAAARPAGALAARCPGCTRRTTPWGWWGSTSAAAPWTTTPSTAARRPSRRGSTPSPAPPWWPAPRCTARSIRHAANGHPGVDRRTSGRTPWPTSSEHPKNRAAQAENLKRDVLERWSLRKNYWRWPAAWNRLMEGGDVGRRWRSGTAHAALGGGERAQGARGGGGHQPPLPALRAPGGRLLRAALERALPGVPEAGQQPVDCRMPPGRHPAVALPEQPPDRLGQQTLPTRPAALPERPSRRGSAPRPGPSWRKRVEAGSPAGRRGSPAVPAGPVGAARTARAPQGGSRRAPRPTRKEHSWTATRPRPHRGACQVAGQCTASG